MADETIIQQDANALKSNFDALAECAQSTAVQSTGSEINNQQSELHLKDFSQIGQPGMITQEQFDQILDYYYKKKGLTKKGCLIVAICWLVLPVISAIFFTIISYLFS